MATRTAQRIAIWVIAVVMTVGTLGSYFIFLVADSNQQQQQADLQKQLAALQCDVEGLDPNAQYEKPAPLTFSKEETTELRTEDVVVGTGAEVTSAEQCVAIHYIGNTADGTVFDNSYDRGQPLETFLNQVIAGWSEGIIGMKEGGIRRLYIPADKAYGETGNGAIGPNEPLAFTVQLIKIRQ